MILAFTAGAFVPIQTGTNAYLSKGLGNGMLSTLVVFIIASVTTLIALVVQKPEVPSLSLITLIPWYAWCIGGILGSAYIFLLIYTAPKLGMATVVGVVVLGQMLMAMIIDHFGWLGISTHEINWGRVSGTILMVIGLFIIKKF